MNEDEKPPIFKSWKGWYTLLIAVLMIEILLFFIFSNYFS